MFYEDFPPNESIESPFLSWLDWTETDLTPQCDPQCVTPRGVKWQTHCEGCVVEHMSCKMASRSSDPAGTAETANSEGNWDCQHASGLHIRFYKSHKTFIPLFHLVINVSNNSKFVFKKKKLQAFFLVLTEKTKFK